MRKKVASFLCAVMGEDQKVSVRLLVDKKKNRVISAEAGKDFVDALLSFLTLPLGTIVRIVGKKSDLKPFRVGSLSSLYDGVSDLGEKYFGSEACKEMLLRPRNSMESHQNPKLNVDDSEPIKYFLCENWNECSFWETNGLLSLFENRRCACGKVMNIVLPVTDENIHEGYVNELADFTVSDDLKVMPRDLMASIAIRKDLGVDSVEEMTVDIHKTEVVDLLKLSLLSKTPLTDFFLQKKKVQEDFEVVSLFPFESKGGKISAQAEKSKAMKVKVVLKKSKGKVLFAQAEEDFADFFASFLTFPFGAVLNLLEGNSGSCSLGNLYKSLVDLHASKHLKSEEIKKMLIKPQIAPQFKIQNQILPIDEASAPKFYHHGITLTLLDPKSSIMDTSNPTGFVKGPSMYMVTDDLVIKPISFVSVSSFLNESKVPLHDLEERIISIGPEEALSILKASLISSSALTMGLRPFTKKKWSWAVPRRIKISASRFLMRLR